MRASEKYAHQQINPPCNLVDRSGAAALANCGNSGNMTFSEELNKYNISLFRHTALSDAVIDDVFRFYEEPVLFSFFAKGQPFIGVLIDAEEGYEKWSVTQVTLDSLKRIKGNAESVGFAFSSPIFGYINLYTIDLHDDNHIIELIESKKIDPDIIPTDDTLAHPELIISSKEALSQVRSPNQLGLADQSWVPELLSPAKIFNRLMIDLRLRKDTGEHTIRLRDLAEISRHFQEFLDSAALGIIGSFTNRGKIPEGVKVQTSLDVYAGIPGSFILRMSPENPDLWGNQLLIDGLQRMGSLTDNYDNDEGVRDIVERLGSRATLKYKQLLADLEKTEGGFEVRWASPEGSFSLFGLDASSVSQAYETVSKFSEAEVIEFKVFGTLVAGSIRTLRFEIESEDTVYSGYADKGILSSEHEARLGHRYEAVINEIRTVNRSTGEEIVKYQLKGLREI